MTPNVRLVEEGSNVRPVEEGTRTAGGEYDKIQENQRADPKAEHDDASSARQEVQSNPDLYAPPAYTIMTTTGEEGSTRKLSRRKRLPSSSSPSPRIETTSRLPCTHLKLLLLLLALESNGHARKALPKSCLPGNR
ncbi:hypothetical protein PMIN06_004598 [Paraphaeosphaeria minitans]